MKCRRIVKGEEVHISRTSMVTTFTLRAEFTVVVSPFDAAKELAELTEIILNDEGCYLERHHQE